MTDRLKFVDIEWKMCEQAVFRMQQLIAKAWMDNDINEVMRLQQKLVRMFEARALTVRKVWTSGGGKTPGIDNVIWETNKQLIKVVSDLRNLSEYKPQPVRRVYIPKPNGGQRPIGIPTMYDRAIQTLFALALMPIAECMADKRSYGYRPYRSSHDAMIYLKLVLGAIYGKRWAMEGDIKKFFDNISHEWLLNNVPMDKAMLKKFLKAGFMELPSTELHETNMGTPQGGSISPIIANMVLNGLEDIVGDDYRVVRFADDFVVIGASKKELEQEAMPKIVAFLAQRGLELNMAKTKITNIAKGFDFLGFTFREHKDPSRVKGHKQGIFLVTPAKQKVINFRQRLKSVVHMNRKGTALALIIKLNPMLRGWANYYRVVTAKKVFSSLGYYVWLLLWKWCRNKHPNKPLRELRRMYFKTEGGNRWVFYAKNAKGNVVTLVQMGWIDIVRHTLCKDLNPFLEDNLDYFKSRVKHGAKTSALLNANQAKLLKKQKGLCPVCGNILLNGEPLEAHHIRSRKDGGKDTLRNLLLLHQLCHKQITHSNVTNHRAAWKFFVAEQSSVSKKLRSGGLIAHPGSKLALSSPTKLIVLAEDKLGRTVEAV